MRRRLKVRSRLWPPDLRDPRVGMDRFETAGPTPDGGRRQPGCDRRTSWRRDRGRAERRHALRENAAAADRGSRRYRGPGTWQRDRRCP